MKKYRVICTMIYNGYIEVEAESEQQAVEIANDKREEISWQFGEATIDYAEEVGLYK